MTTNASLEAEYTARFRRFQANRVREGLASFDKHVQALRHSHEQLRSIVRELLSAVSEGDSAKADELNSDFETARRGRLAELRLLLAAKLYILTADPVGGDFDAPSAADRACCEELSRPLA
jgi:hypothetical protein